MPKRCALRSSWLQSSARASRGSDSRAFALLANTIATGGALVAIPLSFGPISGVRLNPAMTLCMVAMKRRHPRSAVGHIAAQLLGGIAGAILANAMFELRSSGGRPPHASVLRSLNCDVRPD